jgi:DNA polymerase
MPETALIPGLLAEAGKRTRHMVDSPPTAPRPAKGLDMPKPAPEEAEYRSLTAARKAAEHCTRCPLYKHATQTVFGEGPVHAAVVFVGEQPGDQEDLAGKPFVGPAGKTFDAVLEEADFDRKKTYVTNAVKHFKFEPRGKKRIHSKPNAGEIQACRWWLDTELKLIRPELAVALGATAAQSLLGKTVPVTKLRGTTMERDDGLSVFITVHPSYLLRIPDEAAKDAERRRFLDDMKKVKRLAGM